MMNRRRWLSLAGLGALSAAAYPALVEPRWLELTHTNIHLGLKGNIRVLHLADMHASFVVPMAVIDRAIKLGLEQQPDLICLTGDFITFGNDFDEEHYVHVLRKLTKFAPTYAVLGNHDGGKWAPAHGGPPNHILVERMLARSGAKLLHNDSHRITINACDLSLIGVGDLWSEEIDAANAFANADESGPILLLSHNPDSKQVLSQYPWSVMLSGHTHGGQVIVPFAGPKFAPVKDKRFVAGLRPWRDRQIFVTRGVGSLGGVRFLCRPEVSLLNLS